MPKADDEIDLFELMATLWKKKGIIVLVTFLTTALA
ncbi:MAG: Wzz/FepE/Etk N-terminal domain-containing protein, partial [Plesiomonas shigelloides]